MKTFRRHYLWGKNPKATGIYELLDNGIVVKYGNAKIRDEWILSEQIKRV